MSQIPKKKPRAIRYDFTKAVDGIRTLIKRFEYDLALEQVQAALNKSGKPIDTRIALLSLQAECLELSNNPARAFVCFRKLIKIEPGEMRWHEGFLRNGKISGAQPAELYDMAERTYAEFPDSPMVAAYLGQACAFRRETQKALEVFERLSTNQRFKKPQFEDERRNVFALYIALLDPRQRNDVARVLFEDEKPEFIAECNELAETRLREIRSAAHKRKNAGPPSEAPAIRRL